MAKRKSTGKRQRFNIFKRDRFTCQYCGRTPPTAVLVIDHILPVAAGGETVEHNLITSCETCNQGKADKPLSEVPQALDAQLAAQVERQEQLEEFNRYLMRMRKKQDSTGRELGTYWYNRFAAEKDRDRYTFNPTRLSSIRTFLARLPVTEIYDAIDVAMSRVPPEDSDDYHTFKYFCGVCWKGIKKREGGDE